MGAQKIFPKMKKRKKKIVAKYTRPPGENVPKFLPDVTLDIKKDLKPGFQNFKLRIF